MSAQADKAEFEIVGTVKSWYADRAGKVIRFTVTVKGGVREKYLDLKYFGALPKYNKGDRVRIVGEPGSEKLLGVTEQGKDGRTYDKWAPMLVATHIEALSRAQATIPGVNDNARERPGRERNDDDIPF